MKYNAGVEKYKQRESGIELVRIIAVLMVIAVHYFGGDEGILSQNLFFSFNHVSFRIIESLCVICVNLFVIITGYFGVTKKGINIRRIVDIIVVVAFWGAASYFFNCISSGSAITTSELVKSVFPYMFGSLWYVRVYLILSLIAPFINMALLSMNRKNYTIFIVVILVLFSLLPSFVPAFENENGYDIIHFVLIYCIGGYIRLHLDKKPPMWICFATWIGFSAITALFSVYGDGLGYWGYDFISVVLSCIALFIMFSQIKFKSAIINYIASLTFGIYVLEGVIPERYKYFGGEKQLF